MAELLEKDLVFRIIGCAMAVHNALGYGLREKLTKIRWQLNSNIRDLSAASKPNFGFIIAMNVSMNLYRILWLKNA